MQISSFLLMFLILLIIIPMSENLITLGALLFLRAILYTLIIANIFNSWFALILFLIYITGLLVLLSYMLALRPNPRHMGFQRFLYFLLFSIIMFLFVDKFIFIKSSIINIRYEWEVLIIFNLLNITIY